MQLSSLVKRPSDPDSLLCGTFRIFGAEAPGLGGDAGWGAGTAPQNFLPLRHHPPQPRGRLEGGGEGYCPLRIPAAWRALEDGLLRAG